MEPTQAQREALQKIADFDHVFMVTDTGDVHNLPNNVATHHAPTVTRDPNNEAPYDIETDYVNWELLKGYTGQYNYSGPAMHASETLSGDLARDILTTPGMYAVVVVEEEEGEPESWAVARCTNAENPLDVWLRHITEYDEMGNEYDECDAEANIFLDDDRYRVDWYLTGVGLVKHQTFDTYRQAADWLTAEGFQDFSA